MKTLSNEPWRGPSSIILGIDVGTTHSAVSFSYLYEGGPQVVQNVSRWPGQEAIKGYSKVPTLVYYDRDLKPMCYGAEALLSESRDRAEDEGWGLAKHFKLHLHPQSMSTQEKLKLDPLPYGVPLATIYKDFLFYLIQHTRSYFESRVGDGAAVWERCTPNMLVVLTHPNGWATREQHFLRQALQNIGPQYKNCRITFVTEGEASVHFCTFYSNMNLSLQPNNDFIVCDAGGSTIDVTSYLVEQITPSLKIKERKASACIQTGGVFIDLECEKYLNGTLSKVGIDEENARIYVAAGVEDFEATAKKAFASPETARRISFHDNNLKQTELGIRRGNMSLEGSIIQSFFDPAVSTTIQSIRQQMQGQAPKYILLVGGFGESPYLRRRLSEEFTSSQCQVIVVEDSTSKAAADGAVIWAVELAVIGRMTRVAYGVPIWVGYDASNPEHRGRKVVSKPKGKMIDGFWSKIVEKDVFLHAQESFRSRFWINTATDDFQGRKHETFSCTVWVYRGHSAENPGWVEDKNGRVNPGFEPLCKIMASLGDIESSLEQRQGPAGPFYELFLDVVIQLGGTELHAHLEWIDNGTTRTGPVTIMPEPVDLPPVGQNMRS